MSVDNHPSIYSRCPACGNDTLTIHDKHLLCTWHTCPNPSLIDRLPELYSVAVQLATALNIATTYCGYQSAEIDKAQERAKEMGLIK